MTSSKHQKKSDPANAKRRMQSEDAETRRTAALVLEVLAGARTPTEAAEALSVSVPRYYSIEARAVEGLVGACRKRPRGPQKSLEREVKKLEEEIVRLRRDYARAQALLRLARRAVGVKPPPRISERAEGNSTKKKSTKGRRKRRATARALRAASALTEPSGEAEEPSEVDTESSVDAKGSKASA